MAIFVRRIIAVLRKYFITTQYWLIAQLAQTILSGIRLLPMKTALDLSGKAARFTGPRTKRHKLSLKNLEMAFPEKSLAEREEIALEMWMNMTRLAAEYVYLDKLSAFDPESPETSNIEVVGVDIFKDLQANPRPFIVFTMHSGNFELLPIISQKFGLRVSALFRPPNNPFLAKKILSARGAHMDDLVASKVGAAWTLARKLDSGGGVGMLVDQKFQRGAKTTFFGHDVITNPLLAKLARQYKCEVFPARCIRLPHGRFRLELQEAITLPKNDKGEVDITATSQLLNDTVEQWVREYPGQWQWFHDRWNIRHSL